MHLKKSVVFLSCILLFSCSDKYHAFKSQYHFRSADGSPDYADLHYWAAHPWKWDPSDSIPQPLKNEPRDSSVDVFFIHPTTYTFKTKVKKINARVDDDYINAKTDYSTILYQASVFNSHARIFAPRYRQVHISVFFFKDKEGREKALDFAYQDIKKAFEFYMSHYNNGRPIIIAGHSQGAVLGERLLKEFFENKSLQEKLVAAYITGWAIPKEYFTGIKLCEDSAQTGCLCGWRTFRKGFIPRYLKNEKGNSFVTNPLTWTSSSEYVAKKKNKGSLLSRFNKIYPATTDARISTGVLWVKKPKFPWGFIYFTRNYHIADMNLFYMNLRENIGQRITRYIQKQEKP